MQIVKYISTLLLAGTMFTFCACKKSFLEVVPKGQSIAVNYSDYDLLMNGSNFYVIGGKTTGIWQAAAIMGDEVAAEAYAYNLANRGYSQGRKLFQWEADIFPLTDPPSDYGASTPYFLTTLLKNLYSLNKIVSEAASAQGGTTQLKLSIRAEAMVQHAFTIFQLLNYFSKPYNAATAATDPGFPIITTADVTATNFKRNTVQECYDYMVDELNKAIPDLLPATTNRTRVCKAAGEGMLGKIYLYMGKYPEALDLFKKCFVDMGQMTVVPVLYDYNKTLAPGGSFLPISSINGPNSPFVNITDITESVWAAFTYAAPYNGNSFSQNFLTIPAKTISLFGNDDWRLQFYTNLQEDRTTPIPGGRLRRYNQLWTRIGLQLPDLYLMKAEAEARTGDLTSAVTDVQALRMKRMPAASASVPAAIANNKDNLTRFIIDERVREFAVEGSRWFDLRRLSTDPLFSVLPAAQHIVYTDAANGTTYTLKPDRLTLKLPPFYLSQNPGMADNP